MMLNRNPSTVQESIHYMVIQVYLVCIISDDAVIDDDGQ